MSRRQAVALLPERPRRTEPVPCPAPLPQGVREDMVELLAELLVVAYRRRHAAASVSGPAAGQGAGT